MVLARTAGSKVFGVHSADGSVIWSHFVPPLTPTDAPPALHALFVAGHGTSPQALVVAQGAAKWAVESLHPFSGKTLGQTSADGTVLHAAKLPVETAAGVAPLLIVDTALKVHLYPATAETSALLTEHAASIFFHILEPAKPALTGYSLAPSGSGFVAVQRWSMVFPGEGAKVTHRRTLPIRGCALDPLSRAPHLRALSSHLACSLRCIYSSTQRVTQPTTARRSPCDPR